ncbi:MAG: C2H2-type zinc finger protein [Cetobacterium sp.]
MSTCDKCGKIFNNSYNYTRHINRKVSCNTIFKCHVCESIFSEKRKLDRHSNKINPCVGKIIRSDAEIMLEITKLKLKDKEKERKEHEKHRQHEKEILEIKKQNTLEIERVKTERKEKTVTHINEVHIQNNIQNTINNNIKLEQKFIQNINHIYGKNPNIIPLDAAAEALINSIIRDPKLTMELFHGFESRDDLVKMCLKRLYEVQSNKPIAYNDALETYYNISNNSNIGELNIEKTEFVNIQPDIKRNLIEILITLYGVSGISGCKTQIKLDNAFDERLKKIDNTRKFIEDIDIHPASSDVFSC